MFSMILTAVIVVVGIAAVLFSLGWLLVMGLIAEAQREERRHQSD